MIIELTLSLWACAALHCTPAELRMAEDAYHACGGREGPGTMADVASMTIQACVEKRLAGHTISRELLPGTELWPGAKVLSYR